MLGSSGPWGSCSNASMCCSSSCKHLYTLRISVASMRALSIFALSAVRKIYSMVPVAVHATLFGKWELTARNAFSVLSGEPYVASQSSTRPHAERVVATWYHMLYGGHWLPPSSGASGCYPAGYPSSSSVEPQAPLPAGYPADYTNYLGIARCVNCSLNPW